MLPVFDALSVRDEMPFVYAGHEMKTTKIKKTLKCFMQHLHVQFILFIHGEVHLCT